LKNAAVLGTVGTTENDPILFDTVADHLAAAVIARRRQSVDGALERVESMLATAQPNGERLIVVIATNITFCHG
jgi:hypothetical protein